MLVHGYDAWEEVGGDMSMFNAVISTLGDWGWHGKYRIWAYYGCDDTEALHNYDMNQFGDHKKHLAGFAHGQRQSCGAPHDRYTSIEHLGHHFAWAIYEKWTKEDVCVTAIGHSMGGLIIRYALAQTQLGHPDFPPSLCIEAAVTWGTPHAGSTWWACVEGSQPCQMFPDSDLMAWLAQNAQNPQGEGGTEWTVVGSTEDDLVTETSATSMDADHKVIYTQSSAVVHSADDGLAYYEATSAAQTAAVRYWNRWQGNSWVTTPNGFWPVVWTANSMVHKTWGCGTQANPWPIPTDKLVFAERTLGAKDCYFQITSTFPSTDLVAQTTARSADVDLYISSASQPETCSVTDAALEKLCHLQDVAPSTWILRTDDTAPSGSAASPFAVRAVSFKNLRPEINTLQCTEFVVRNRPATCSFSATDDSPGISYKVDWSPSSSARIPSSGTVAPGLAQTASNVWSFRGTFDVVARATDNAPKNPLTSLSKTTKVTVVDLPGAPGSVAATPTAVGTLGVSWNPPVDDGGSSILRYTVSATSDGSNVVNRVVSADAFQGTAVELSDLGNGKSWSVVVMAESKAGQGLPSTTVKAQTWTTPSAPMGLKVDGVSDSTAILTWSSPASNGGSTVTDYNVYAGNSTENFTLIHTGVQRRFVHDDAVAPTWFRVAALNAVGEGRFAEATYSGPNLTSLANGEGQNDNDQLPTATAPGSGLIGVAWVFFAMVFLRRSRF